jgi:hypothetical protein
MVFLEDDVQDLQVYPNPFSSLTTISFNNDKLENYSLSIYNILGAKVKYEENILAEKYILEKGNLKSGIYNLELRSESKSYYIKMIVQ